MSPRTRRVLRLRLRLPVLATVFIAVAAASGCDDSGAASDRQPAAPVQFEGKDSAGMAGVTASAGDSVVYGQSVVKNTGSRPAELHSATLVGTVPSTSAAGTEERILDLTKPHDLIGAGPWPYQDYAQASVPLAGYQLQPGAEAEVLYIIAVKKDGYWSWPRPRITSSVDGKSYSDTGTYGFEVCSPDCPNPDWKG